ncbi:MAG: NAD(P)-dependent oxidoreductase [Polyangiaceae bacterium]|jgi:3-hydroxyisobutyrate dehydrogenase|nr:NAD(P)-dependent oxidoreductase [Polyangiaceae bacterium]
MSKVSVLGLGAMGSRMASKLLAAGHAVTVWNRTPERAQALREAGATVAATPREAAVGASFVIAMVRDDAASRDVWTNPTTGALAALGADALAIESSTLSLEWVATLASRCHERGVGFLDAPVAGSRPQADAGQLIYFVGGQAAELARAKPVLEAMGAAVHHAGPSGAGAAVKLAVNALFGVQVAALAELIGWLRKAGLDAPRAMEILAATPVCSPAAKGASASMLAAAFAPAFPVELVEKDFGCLRAAATIAGSALPVAKAAGDVFSLALNAGQGEENLTSVVKLYR